MSNSLITQSNVEVVEESARKIFSLTNEDLQVDSFYIRKKRNINKGNI